MDRTTRKKLDHLLLKEEAMTINQFQVKLGHVLGAEAPLVKQLDNWEADDYTPDRLLSLKAVLRQEIVEKTPTFGSLKETAKYYEDDLNGVRSLRDILLELSTVQHLHQWVSNYKHLYDSVVKTT